MMAWIRITWAILKKDVRIWLRQPTNVAATLVPALSFLLVQALGAAAVGRSPVALVELDQGVQGQQVTQAIIAANVFRIHLSSPAQAQMLLRNLDVVAVITIPADFSQRFQAHQPNPVDVTVNNLNLDFTNDIRRAVPDAITQYYQAQGSASPIKISVNEIDLRKRDVELFQYAVLPTVVMLLMISGVLTAGLATAREWETRTIKEVLLSPAPNGAIIAGKVLAGFTTTFFLGALVLALGYALGYTRPEGIYWLSTLGIVALVALFGSGLGVALGALIQRIQPMIGVSINAALYLFFLSGGIGVLAFEPAWLQNLAAFIPLTYGTHALQMAIFYSSADLLGRDVAVLVVSSVITLVLGVLAMRRQISS
jgi:ABC-type multidrug transport system permease subunit